MPVTEHTDPRVDVVWNKGQVSPAMMGDATLFIPMLAVWVDHEYRYTVGWHNKQWATFTPDSEPVYHQVH